ncbi:MAG: MFS transporter [Promethearchaeota archaeon]
MTTKNEIKDKVKEKVATKVDKGMDILEHFQKKTEKTQKGLFKDIEISKEKFVLLYLLFISLGSIFALHVKLSLSFLSDIQIFGLSAVVFGALLGLFIASILADIYKNRYSPLMVVLSFSGISVILERFIFQNISLAPIISVIGFINSAIFGFVAVYMFVLFIEFTNMLERGRVFAFLLFTGGGTIIFIIAMVYIESLLILPSVIPLISIYFLYKYRNTKLKAKNDSGNEVNGKSNFNLKNFKIDFHLIKNLPFILNVLMLFAFGIINGIMIPVEQSVKIVTNEIFQEYFFLVLLASIIILGMITLFIGYIFDFLGRRTVISVFILVIGTINFIKSALEQRGIIFDTQYAIITTSLLIELMIIIPLTVGELVKPEKYGIATAGSIICSIGGFMLGIGFQIFVESTWGIKSLTAFLCIIILFFLVHIKETISRIELDWPESLYHLYIVHESGLLIYEHSFVEEDLATSDLVSGGIIGLVTMLKEITKSKDRLRTIDHGNKKIMFRWSSDGNVIFVLVVKYELIVLRNKLKEFATEFEQHFGREKMQLEHGVNVADWEDTKFLIDKYFTRKILTDQVIEKLQNKIRSKMDGTVISE